MNKNKIFNDPIYGFITVDYELIFDLIEHPYFQRLRRIRQVGLTHLIYPGANHTRFHHALGAYHLMTQAIRVLRSKGVDISEAEAEGASAAILLHDLGHGPFSHALEHVLIDCSHEELTLALMHQLNQEFSGALDLAIQMFSNRYQRRFFHELISGQLDMDRMDYLSRDSFYSGVVEGRIGYDRIIKMLHVKDDRLVVEEKGLQSIESFLVARKIMYWQVYLHKAVLSAELMLKQAIKRARWLYKKDPTSIPGFENRDVIFSQNWNDPDQRGPLLKSFLDLDDYDIVVFLKKSLNCGDFLLKELTHGLTQRKLFRVEIAKYPFKSDYVDEIRLKVVESTKIPLEEAGKWVFSGHETVRIYSEENEIRMLLKNGKYVPLSSISDDVEDAEVTRYYICYPKHIVA